MWAEKAECDERTRHDRGEIGLDSDDEERATPPIDIYPPMGRGEGQQKGDLHGVTFVPGRVLSLILGLGQRIVFSFVRFFFFRPFIPPTSDLGNWGRGNWRFIRPTIDAKFRYFSLK